jgi:PAS domain S-box-containing protein
MSRVPPLSNLTLFDLPDVIVLFDADTFRVLDVNRNDGAFGYSRKAFLELDAFALFPRWWGAAKTIADGHAIATALHHKNGDEIEVDVRIARATSKRDVLVATIRTARSTSDIQRELAETNAYLHAIVENIPDMIFVKDSGSLRFRRFNRAGEELLGFSRGDLLGKTDFDFYPKAQAESFRKGDLQAIKRGAIVDIAAETIRTKHQGERILRTRKIPLSDASGAPRYLLGISEDITERTKAEGVAREFADVVRYLRDAVVTWQKDGSIVSWNPGAERLYGARAEDVIGKSFFTFVPESQIKEFRARAKAVLAKRDVGVMETTRLSAEGREVDVEESMFAILDASGDVQRVASIARDLTELARWRRATELLSHARSNDADDGPKKESRSEKMRETIKLADRVAKDANATVLLLGETGVGKSWLARRIHASSPRADRPFFEVNCASLARELTDSEFFGHERGAFTGAVTQKRGLVETADGGTLFLDEVAEIPIVVQARLLTFLDAKLFRRVGGNRAMTADVRIVCATNVDLAEAVREGRFRRDLYYRLRVVPITVPPLRERDGEIVDLARIILDDIARRSGRTARFAANVLPALRRYAWPGNIRELRNAIERALIITDDDVLRLEHLPIEIRESVSTDRPADSNSADSLRSHERRAIREALDAAKGNRTHAAKKLGISRSTLKRKIALMRGPS